MIRINGNQCGSSHGSGKGRLSLFKTILTMLGAGLLLNYALVIVLEYIFGHSSSATVFSRFIVYIFRFFTQF